MTIQYEISEQNGLNVITFANSGGGTCNFVVNHDITDNSLNEQFVEKEFRIMENKLTMMRTPTYHQKFVYSDDMYQEGILIRRDYADGTSESDLLKQELIDNFPSYLQKRVLDGMPLNEEYDVDILNYGKIHVFLIGKQDNKIYLYKEGFADKLIKYLPIWNVRNIYELQYSRGMQFIHDLETKEVNLRLYALDPLNYFDSQLLPEINPNHLWEYNAEYNKLGEKQKFTIKMFANHQFINDYCTTNNTIKPLPENSNLRPWCYSFIFNNDNTLIKIQAHVRTYKPEISEL